MAEGNCLNCGGPLGPPDNVDSHTNMSKCVVHLKLRLRDALAAAAPRASAATAGRPGFAEIVMGLAQSLARRSTCSRLQVGCVIVSPDFRKVISWGYNGGATGQDNECESDEPGKCGHIHAEANALVSCDAPRGDEKVVFVTDLPCPMCAKMIVNLGGVVEVVYGRDYRVRDGLVILDRAAIRSRQLSI